jgi:hypothetical protein
MRPKTIWVHSSRRTGKTSIPQADHLLKLTWQEIVIPSCWWYDVCLRWDFLYFSGYYPSCCRILIWCIRTVRWQTGKYKDLFRLPGTPVFTSFFKLGKFGVTMRTAHTVLFSIALGASSALGAGWNFVQNGTSGVLALEAMIVSPTLAILFDRASNDPLMINNNPAWGALWNLETNTASPLLVVSDTFCASGGFLSNGTMVRPVIPKL